MYLSENLTEKWNLTKSQKLNCLSLYAYTALLKIYLIHFIASDRLYTRRFSLLKTHGHDRSKKIKK